MATTITGDGTYSADASKCVDLVDHKTAAALQVVAIRALNNTSYLKTAVDATVTVANAAIPKATGSAANQLLLFSAASTPGVLDVAASRIVGRKASGDVDDLTAAEVKTILTASATAGASTIPISGAGNNLAQGFLATGTATAGFAGVSDGVGGTAWGVPAYLFDNTMSFSDAAGMTNGYVLTENTVGQYWLLSKAVAGDTIAMTSSVFSVSYTTGSADYTGGTNNAPYLILSVVPYMLPQTPTQTLTIYWTGTITSGIASINAGGEICRMFCYLQGYLTNTAATINTAGCMCEANSTARTVGTAQSRYDAQTYPDTDAVAESYLTTGVEFKMVLDGLFWLRCFYRKVGDSVWIELNAARIQTHRFLPSEIAFGIAHTGTTTVTATISGIRFVKA